MKGHVKARVCVGGGRIGSSKGGALPVIVLITGPRETHDYRDYRRDYNL